MSEENKISVLRLALILSLICACSTGVMAFFFGITRAPVEKAKTLKNMKALKKVLPDFDNDPYKDSLTFGEMRILRAKKNGRVIAAAAECSSPNGYGGRVKGLAGFSPEGKILNVVITEHNETPGLGSKFTDPDNAVTLSDLLHGKKKKDASNRYLDQFKGHSASSSDAWKKHPWLIRSAGGEVDAVSGATVTSKAVTELVWEAASCVTEHRKAIFEEKKQ